jgi:hypothetical protein
MGRGHFEDIGPRFRQESKKKKYFRKNEFWKIGVELSGSDYSTFTKT